MGNKNNYFEIFKNHEGYISHKWVHYLFLYQELLDKFIERDKPVNILEIGVHNGGSLEIWKEFLPKESKVFGVDIEKKCLDLNFPENVQFFLGDATKESFWKENMTDVEFDIILDDGSHICYDVIKSFEILFKDKLKNGGIYIVEDLHTSYAKDCAGGFRRKGSSIEYFKDLTDSLGTNYFNKEDLIHRPKFKIPFLSNLFKKKLLSQEEHENLREYNSIIKRISFYDSVCAIEKYETELKAPFYSALTGQKTGVISDEILQKIPHVKNLNENDLCKNNFIKEE